MIYQDQDGLMNSRIRKYLRKTTMIRARFDIRNDKNTKFGQHRNLFKNYKLTEGSPIISTFRKSHISMGNFINKDLRKKKKEQSWVKMRNCIASL